MAKSPKDGQLIYHFTCLDNLLSIIEHGLLPRNRISGFKDVADPEIILQRGEYGLNDYIPFHFFCRNPFDGVVQKTHPDFEYMYLTITRRAAIKHDFKILPTHPIYFFHNYQNIYPEQFKNNFIIPFDYTDGYDRIEWDIMNKRDYGDEKCKQVCMAECLYKGTIGIQAFSGIYVKTKSAEKWVRNVLKEYDIKNPPYINCNPNMFL